MEDKILTAEEFAKSYQFIDEWTFRMHGEETIDTYQLHRFAIEFAQYHVKKALEAAANNAECDEDTLTGDWSVNENSILSAYNIEDIK